MKLSAKKQFKGKISAVQEGSVNDIVTIDVKGTPVMAPLSMAVIKELGIKATKVMVGSSPLKLSARNKFSGKVASVTEGAVNSIVAIETPAFTITSTISNEAVKELGLKAGSDAVAVVKATSVMVAC